MRHEYTEGAIDGPFDPSGDALPPVRVSSVRRRSSNTRDVQPPGRQSLTLTTSQPQVQALRRAQADDSRFLY